MPSAHDLRKLLSQEADDDDEDDDTGIFIEKLERHSSSTRGGSSSASSGGSSDMTYAVVEYIHRKHGRLAKRVVAIEKRIDKAQWTIIAACSTGTLLVTVLYKLFESFVLKK